MYSESQFTEIITIYAIFVLIFEFKRKIIQETITNEKKKIPFQV